ncbi:hypothetical protein Tco_0941107 [Tanacetum coccineum]|uniref:DNA primase n=1 Tax=Tanacetum coccineum TaxID=301880 RepID=A0ABQ5DQJ2_9ASTR
MDYVPDLSTHLLPDYEDSRRAADYLLIEGDGDDEPSDDDSDDDTDEDDDEPFEDEDDDEEEEEEHLALADPSAVPIADPVPYDRDTDGI